MLAKFMEDDLQSRQQAPSPVESAEMIAFTLQRDQVLSERTLVKDLLELIKRTPDVMQIKHTFPRKYSDTLGIFNKKARWIIQRLIQKPVNVNQYGTRAVTHVQWT